MAEELSTIARPYAQAVFELAKADNAYAKWGELLDALAVIVSDAEMQRLLDNPRVSKEQTTDLLKEICGNLVDDQANNMIRLLVENNRVKALPEMANIYATLRKEAEATIQAQVYSAYPLTDAQASSIQESLKKKLGKNVELENIVDASMLGGAIIRAGDLIIDGSVQGKLAKLSAVLNS